MLLVADEISSPSRAGRVNIDGDSIPFVSMTATPTNALWASGAVSLGRDSWTGCRPRRDSDGPISGAEMVHSRS